MFNFLDNPPSIKILFSTDCSRHAQFVYCKSLSAIFWEFLDRHCWRLHSLLAIIPGKTEISLLVIMTTLSNIETVKSIQYADAKNIDGGMVIDPEEHPEI